MVSPVKAPQSTRTSPTPYLKNIVHKVLVLFALKNKMLFIQCLSKDYLPKVALFTFLSLKPRSDAAHTIFVLRKIGPCLWTLAKAFPNLKPFRPYDFDPQKRVPDPLMLGSIFFSIGKKIVKHSIISGWCFGGIQVVP